jgi:uncharacterized membrane protein (UPF0127 family)
MLSIQRFRSLSFLSVVFFILALSFNLESKEGEKSLPTTTVIVPPDIKIEAEIAYTDETRMRGLMFRESLPADSGMLFIFPFVEQHSFWMKNTLIPLDIIWLNQRKEVVYFTTAVPCTSDPCDSYIPMQTSKYVLEVNGGFAKKHNLKVGSRLEFTIPTEIERIANR